MNKDIKQLLEQSLAAHYKYVLPRLPEKEKLGFMDAHWDNTNETPVLYSEKLKHKHYRIGYNKFLAILREIEYNIEKRFITGDSRDFIFEKL